MRKIRILCVLLCVLLVIGSVPFYVSAENSEVEPDTEENVCYIETYEQLKDLAYSARSDYRYVINDFIFKDDNQNNWEIVIPTGVSFNLDLNGYPIERVTKGNDCALFCIKSGATMIIDDTSESHTGSCSFSEGYSSYQKAVFINDGGHLIIKDGYYEILSPYEQGDCSVVRTTSGITEIYGGTFDSSTAWGGDTISVGHYAYLYDVPQVLIYGGTFFGKYQSIDISPMNNFLGYGSLFPDVFVMGGDFYICNKGTDKITPSFAYCNNHWGRVIVAQGTVYASCLNSYDQRFLSGTSKKLFSENIDGFTGGYYEVTAPPMIMTCNEEKLDYYERLALLCSKEVARSYNEETNLMFKEVFDQINSQIDTIYVEETETESPEIKLVNRTLDHKYVRWYFCDEASYNGENTNWTHLSDYNDVSQWQFKERPEDAQNLLIRCVVTNSDLTIYEDIVRISYEPLKETETVSSVEIKGIDTPEAGKAPDFDVTAEDSFYINGIFWTDITDPKNKVTLKETDTFEAGHEYQLEIWIRANEYYNFKTDSDGWIDITALVDGKEAEVILPGSAISAELTLTYTVSADPEITDSTDPSEPSDITEATEPSTSTEDKLTDPAETTEPSTTADPTEPSTGADSTEPAKPSEPSSGDETPTASAAESTTEATKPSEATTSSNPTEPSADKGILGDVNGDGKVNIKDATQIQKYAAKLVKLTESELVRADVNADNKVNVKDATAIQKYVAKIETGYPIGKPCK